jgi:hypothetical protein
MTYNYLGNEIEMYPVLSSNVAEVGYDSQNETVLVRFMNNTLYIYKGVNEVIFEELRTTASVGSYINRNFKNVYPYERIE